MANKGDLIATVSEKVGITKKAAEKAVNAVLEVVSGTLAKGDGITIVGFGSFKVVKKAAREGRNPQTGKKIKIPAKKAVVFRAGSKLKSAVSK